MQTSGHVSIVINIENLIAKQSKYRSFHLVAMLLNPNTASKSDYLGVLIRTPVNFDKIKHIILK